MEMSFTVVPLLPLTGIRVILPDNNLTHTVPLGHIPQELLEEILETFKADTLACHAKEVARLATGTGTIKR